MNLIGIFNETDYNLNDVVLELKEFMNYSVKQLTENRVEFNIIIIDKEKMKNLNKKYRKIDDYTDVLSFALGDDINYKNIYLLGDIYISIEEAKKQAKFNKYSLLKELEFLAVHGFLHLLGYDHETKEDEKVMFAKQEEVLNGFKYKK